MTSFFKFYFGLLHLCVKLYLHSYDNTTRHVPFRSVIIIIIIFWEYRKMSTFSFAQGRPSQIKTPLLWIGQQHLTHFIVRTNSKRNAAAGFF